MLKADWEKTGETAPVDDAVLRAMAAQAMPGRKVESLQLIPGGCANLNARVTFSGLSAPVILRIYLRDKAAASRESALSALVTPNIPAPRFLYTGDFGDYRFALAECLEGVTLRDVLLDRVEDPLCAVHDAGRICAMLQRRRFPHPGSFDEHLTVKPQGSPPDYMAFAEECLSHPFTLQQFGAAKVDRLRRLLESRRDFFPDDTQAFLVHGDYDPANILVRRDGAGWTVSGILDWEFAFSGPWLWDVSNMLRYAHLLPPTYEGAFLEGLQDGGAQLPPEWRVTMRLMNLLSLLYCLLGGKQGNKPRQCADISKLTDYIADWLDAPRAASV